MDFALLAFVCGMGFIGAFIDTVVGGGGLITVPALMCTGLSPLQVLGTNKGAAVIGAATGFYTFVKSGKVDGGLIKKLFPLSFLGSAVGVLVVRQVPPDFLRPLVVVMLIAVLLYSLFKGEWGKDSTYQGMTGKLFLLSCVISFVFGFYDGFFGPGTGSFMLFAFLMVGFDFVGAAANARALNFASNLAAVLLFGLIGAIDFSLAIPMGLSCALGAFCGAKVAISKGVGYVRPLFICVTTVLIGKQLWDLFK